MSEDKDTEEFKKTAKRLQEDYQLELESENEIAETKSEENSEKEEDEQRN